MPPGLMKLPALEGAQTTNSELPTTGTEQKRGMRSWRRGGRERGKLPETRQGKLMYLRR